MQQGRFITGVISVCPTRRGTEPASHRLGLRKGFATPRPRTDFQGVERCETVLQNQFDWRYLYAILTNTCRIAPRVHLTEER